MTMLLQIGLALLVIWVMNLMLIIYALLSHTPNWRERDNSTDLMLNFIANASTVQIQMLHNAVKMQPWCASIAILCIIAAMII